MKTAAGILETKPVQTVYTTTPETSVFEAVKTLAEHDIGALLVMSGDQLVGIFSERDYARKIALLARSSRDTPVSAIMSPQVLCVRPDRNRDECMALMSQNRVRHLPVMDGGQLLGVISIGDLVKDIISEQQFVIHQLELYISGSRE